MLTVAKFSIRNGPWAMLTPELYLSVGWDSTSYHNLNYRENAMAVIWTAADLHPGLAKFTTVDTAGKHSQWPTENFRYPSNSCWPQNGL